MYYDGSHAVIFGEKHSWDDWFLVPTRKPVISPPQLKANYVEIPGRDGAYDMSEWLSGGPVYGNRTGTIEFVVDIDRITWEDAVHNITNYLHGKRLRLILLDDLTYYYEGRFAINALKTDKIMNTIAINYVLDPFKKRVHGPNPDGERLI